MLPTDSLRLTLKVPEGAINRFNFTVGKLRALADFFMWLLREKALQVCDLRMHKNLKKKKIISGNLFFQSMLFITVNVNPSSACRCFCSSWHCSSVRHSCLWDIPEYMFCLYLLFRRQFVSQGWGELLHSSCRKKRSNHLTAGKRSPRDRNYFSHCATLKWFRFRLNHRGTCQDAYNETSSCFCITRVDD